MLFASSIFLKYCEQFPFISQISKNRKKTAASKAHSFHPIFSNQKVFFVNVFEGSSRRVKQFWKWHRPNVLDWREQPLMISWLRPTYSGLAELTAGGKMDGGKWNWPWKVVKLRKINPIFWDFLFRKMKIGLEYVALCHLQ